MESSYTRNHYKIDEDVQKNTSNTKSAMNFPTRPKPKASCLPTAQRQKLNGNYLMPTQRQKLTADKNVTSQNVPENLWHNGLVQKKVSKKHVFRCTVPYRLGFSYLFLNLCCVSTVYNLLHPSRCVFDFISVSLYFDWPTWICTYFLNVVVCQWRLKSERQELNGIRRLARTYQNPRQGQNAKTRTPTNPCQDTKRQTTNTKTRHNVKTQKTQCQVQLCIRVVIQMVFVVCEDLVYVWSNIGNTKCV